MSFQGRDDRQMKAFTGFSHAPCDSLLPVCSALAKATPPQRDAEGLTAGTRRRTPGGGTQGPWPTRAEQLLVVLSYSKAYPTCDGRGSPCDRARSKAHDNLQKLSPLFSDPLVHCARMP